MTPLMIAGKLTTRVAITAARTTRFRSLLKKPFRYRFHTRFSQGAY